MKILEKDIQKAILSYLELKRIFHWRNNTGAFKTEGGGFMKFGQRGSPDIFVVKAGQIIGLEVKAPKGTQSDYQLSWQISFQEAGGLYYIVRSLDEVIKIL